MNPTRPGLRSARIGGTGPAVALAAVVLVAACVAGGVGAAPSRAPADGGDGPTGLRVFMSDATVDTLDFPWREVFPAAIGVLERDKWAIQRADTSGRRIVTRWKDIDHLLARLTLGTVHARCVVDLVPVGDDRTAVTFRAGMASAEDLEENPAYPAARITSERAAGRWMGRLRNAMSRTAAETTLTR